MNKTEIMNKATKAFYKVGFTLKKHSPEILVVAGVVGTVVSAVLACRATTKVSEIMTDTKIDVDAVHKCLETQSEEDYSREDGKKDLVIIYAKTGFELAKLYAPSVLLGVASITSILASNNILRKRNVALTAAYATLDKCFKEYRGNVVERFGEQVDRELRYAIKAKKFEETVVDEKTGKEKTRQRKVFPSYVLVKMIITDESWYIVRNTKGVTGFVGPGSKPVPLSDEEVKAMGIEIDVPKVVNPDVDLEIGDAVEVAKGPFSGQVGTVEEINLETREAKVCIDAFGKKTLFVIEFENIQKI